MIYLLWALLNISLFIYFIVISFKATKFLREKLGLFASVIFVFGLLSFVSNTNKSNDNNEPNSNKIKTWKFVSQDSLQANHSYLMNIDLEKTLVSKYVLGINYGQSIDKLVRLPVSAHSSTTGFISGTNWKPAFITVYATEDNKEFEYCVYGTIDWELLGATIYSQSKEFKGTVLIK